MPFKPQAQVFTQADFVDLEKSADVTIENQGTTAVVLAFDEAGMNFIVPLPAGTGRDLPYTGDYLTGRLHFKPVTEGESINVLIIKRVFVCETKN